MEKDINYSKFRGNLTRKPELKGNDKKYALLNIACNRGYQNKDGKKVYSSEYIIDSINYELEKQKETESKEIEKEK